TARCRAAHPAPAADRARAGARRGPHRHSGRPPRAIRAAVDPRRVERLGARQRPPRPRPGRRVRGDPRARRRCPARSRLTSTAVAATLEHAAGMVVRTRSVGTDGYLRRLRRGHDIEVQGEAVYAAVARASRSPQRKRQWDALRRLETVTKLKLADVLAGSGSPAHEAAWARLSGQLVGLVAAPLPLS